MYMYIYYIIVGGMHNRVQLYQIGPFYAMGLMGIISNTDVAQSHRRPFVQMSFCYKF